MRSDLLLYPNRLAWNSLFSSLLRLSGDHATIAFESPANVTRFRIATGNEENPFATLSAESRMEFVFEGERNGEDAHRSLSVEMWLFSAFRKDS